MSNNAIAKSLVQAANALLSAIQSIEGGNVGSDVTVPEKRIVIGQRGWVWIGDYTKRGSEVKIENAYCIRIWGTEKGLGELCDGPVDKTVLDPAGTVRIHELAVVGTYECNETMWNATLLKLK